MMLRLLTKLNRTTGTLFFLAFVLFSVQHAGAIGKLGNPVNTQCQKIVRNVGNALSGNNTPAFSMPYPPDVSTLYDDQAFVMQNLYSNIAVGGNDGWFFKSGATFTENTDGTALLTGTIQQYSDLNRSFDVSIQFTGRTWDPTTLPAPVIASPENRLGVSTSGWYYYTWGAATLTGHGSLEGGKLSLNLHHKALQVGMGGDQFAPDISKLSASGWFSWTVVSQPTGGILFSDYVDGNTSDVAFICDGSATIPCTDNPCINYPKPVLTATNPTNGAANGCINITNLPAGSFSSIDNGAHNAQQSQYCGLAAGTYTVYISNGTCSTNATIILTNTYTAKCMTYDVSSTYDYCKKNNAAYAVYIPQSNPYYQAKSLKFIQNCDGTAKLTGTAGCSNGQILTINVNFTGYTTVAATGSPKTICFPITNTADFFYYTSFTGTIQFGNSAPLTIEPFMHPFQVGTGGDEQDKSIFGASGWFKMSNGVQGDFNFRLNNPAPTVNPCPSGNIYCERWMNQSNWNYPVKWPSSSCNEHAYLSALEFIPSGLHYNKNYTSHVKGWITAPETGWYQFNVSGDDNVDFYLSSDNDKSHNNKICSVSGYTGWHEYNKYSCQTSKGIWLTTGQKYYCELAHQQYGGSDFFSVCWKKPSNGSWNVIPGNSLTPDCSLSDHVTDLQSAHSTLSIAAYPEYKKARIEWTANNGTGNDYFSIQKLNEQGAFDDLELTNAYQQNDDAVLFHTYDNQPVAGENFYRVKLSKLDGTVTYSDIKKVVVGETTGVIVFPNPASDFIQVDLSEYAGKSATIYLYNQQGQPTGYQKIDSATSAPVQIDLNEQNSGLYMIRITSPGKRDNVKQFYIVK